MPATADSPRERLRRPIKQSKKRPPPLVLQKHQQEATKACLDALASGKDRIAACSPTGSGKTIMMMFIVDQLWKKDERGEDEQLGQIMLIVPSIQIAVQTMETAKRVLQGQLQRDCTVALEQGGNESDGSADLKIATWQALSRSLERLQKFDPRYFELILIDEAHHAAAPSFLRLLNYFHVDVELHETTAPIIPKHNHKVPLLGFSATLDRSDHFSIIGALPDRVYHGTAGPLIRSGKLCRTKYLEIKGCLDLQYLRETRDKEDEDEEEQDKNEDEVNARDEKHYSQSNMAMIKALKFQAEFQDRKFVLVFCKRIGQVRSLRRAMREADMSAEMITGKTPLPKRGSLLEDFKAERFSVLINCGVLVEGVDLPHVDCIVNARPTKSLILMSQMVGRGYRVSKETKKRDCLVIDFTSEVPTVAAEVYALMDVLRGPRAEAEQGSPGGSESGFGGPRKRLRISPRN